MMQRMTLLLAAVVLAVMVTGCGEAPAAGSATAAENPAKADMLKFMQALNDHDQAKMAGMIDDKFVDHNPPPGCTPDKAGLVGMFKDYFVSFPDVKSTVDLCFADGDLVVVKVTTTATNDGPFAGQPATHKKINIDEIHIVRIVNGKAVEHWGLLDDTKMAMQLGLMSEAPPAGGQ